MEGKILEIIIVFIVYEIISIIIDLKMKNFILERYNNVLIIIIYFVLFIDLRPDNGFGAETYYLYIPLLVPFAIFGIYIVLKKSKTYYFRGIDKKFIKENTNDISKIIEDFKNNYLDDKAEVSFVNNRIIFEKVSKTEIAECLSLVGNYLDENREKYTIKYYVTYYTKTIAIPVVIAATIAFVLMKITNYESPLADVEQIDIENEFIVGNTEGNINNYGLVAETDESIYYVKDCILYKSDKDLKNETMLVDEPINIGKDTINVVENWIFFRQGKEIRRIQTDGTNIETIYKGYSLHMQVLGNWIYFISLGDDSKICRIDVNGQNKQVMSDKNIDDMAIYNGKIYYSYENPDDKYLEVMNIDGSGKRFLSNLETRNMIVDEEYIYYLDNVEEILYRMNLKYKSKERLSNEHILKFIKDNNWIFYSIQDPNNSDWRYKGLFRMNADGSNVLALDSENYLDEAGIGDTEDFVFYVSTNGKVQPSLKIINKDGTIVK